MLKFSKEEIAVDGVHHIYFDNFQLSWLKLLAKLTVKERVRLGQSISSVRQTVRCLLQLDKFLVDLGYTRPEHLSDSLLMKFISGSNRRDRAKTLEFATRLWKEEGWLFVRFVVPKRKNLPPKIEVIPEEVLHQIYQNFDLFPELLERLFRLQIALGCRISELLMMPRTCLKQEDDYWFLLRWIAKRKKWEFFQVHPKVAELVLVQQQFLNQEFGVDSNFDKLFCWLSVRPNDGAIGSNRTSRFKSIPVYRPKMLDKQIICRWLKAFCHTVNLKDQSGKRFHLTSHMFRRTKASIMAYCEIEDEYIAAVLGHASLDMLPHYRKRSLERLERQSEAKGYVDMYGRVTTFKPQRRRYERLAELMKISTPLGECHRPSMLGDCQYRYACFKCCHHRITLEDKPYLDADKQQLLQDLAQAEVAGAMRRITEINQLLELLDSRLNGLNQLQTMTEECTNVC